MNDADINRRRLELKDGEKRVIKAWKIYDMMYPAVVGAYKPHDYDAKQRYFFDQLLQVRHQIRSLPRTTGERIARIGFIGAAIAVGVFVLWLVVTWLT